jgi:hypothetical protein
VCGAASRSFFSLIGSSTGFRVNIDDRVIEADSFRVEESESEAESIERVSRPSPVFDRSSVTLSAETEFDLGEYSDMELMSFCEMFDCSIIRDGETGEMYFAPSFDLSTGGDGDERR